MIVKLKGVSFMTNIKLKFPEIDQTYAFLDLQTTDKGTVRQITGNIVTAILNPKYCQNQKIIDGQIFFDKFTNEIKFQGKIIGERNIKENQIRLWDDSLNNILGLEIEKHFGINYNANKMWEAIRFVAHQYEVSPPKQYLQNLKWNEAKSFLSKLSDRIRIPYEKYATDVPRTCIFIGTLNERTFLNAHTGERRYLPVECNPNQRIRTIYLDKNNKEILSGKEYIARIREDFNQALALGYEIFKNKTHAWTIPKNLLKDLYNEQEKFKYLNPDVEDIRYFLEEYKPKSADPNITCFKELTMQGYQIKSKSFSEIMDNYFQE